MRYVAGRYLNLLERARAITLTPAVDSLFPATRLYDGYADAVCRFGTNVANPNVTVDLAMLDKDGADNGNLDTWNGGAPTAWTVSTSGTGTVVQTSVGAEVRTGSAAKLNKGSGTAQIKKTYVVRAGERLTADLWMRIAASGQCKAQLQNLFTKKYLTSGAAWQSAQAYFATEIASTTYVEKSLAFTVEDYQANQATDGVTYLELLIEDTGAGGGSDFAFVDDVYLWPTWNAITVVGHNVEAGLTSELRSSTDNFGGSNVLEATLTVRRPAFVGYMSTPSAKRYARLLLTGTQSTPSGAVYLGELAVCYLETALLNEQWGYETQYLDEQTRNERSGKVLVTPYSVDARRVLRVSFRVGTDAMFREGRDEITRRCRGGQWPAIFVPIDTEDVVIHGRLDSSWKVLRQFLSIWDHDLTLSESPFPLVTS